MRILGWVFVIFAFGALVLDGLAFVDGREGADTRRGSCVLADGFAFRSIGCALYDVDDSIPIGIRSLVQNHIDEPLELIDEDVSIYFGYVQPVLLAPAFPWLGGVGVGLILLSFLLRLIFRPTSAARL